MSIFASWMTIRSKTFADLRSLSSAVLALVILSVSSTNNLLKFTFLGIVASSSKSIASITSFFIPFNGDFAEPLSTLTNLELSFSILGLKVFFGKLLWRLRDSSSASFCFSYRTYASYIFHWFAVSEKFTFFIGSVCWFSSYNRRHVNKTSKKILESSKSLVMWSLWDIFVEYRMHSKLIIALMG